MGFLYIIPARGGSKGIPRKNIKRLNGKPLIGYAIDVARQMTTNENICVSTDDDEIIEIVEAYGLPVPFKRPALLSSDTSGTYEVLLHAIEFYEKRGKCYDAIVLLQPTSPFRCKHHVEEALSLFSKDIDMVVSVKEVTANPYYNCFEENDDGFLFVSKGSGNFIRRQDVPKVWEYNGAVYVINIESLKRMSIHKFKKVVKSQMDEISSLDLDSPLDWKIAELLFNEIEMK